MSEVSDGVGAALLALRPLNSGSSAERSAAESCMPDEASQLVSWCPQTAMSAGSGSLGTSPGGLGPDGAAWAALQHQQQQQQQQAAMNAAQLGQAQRIHAALVCTPGLQNVTLEQVLAVAVSRPKMLLLFPAHIVFVPSNERLCCCLWCAPCATADSLCAAACALSRSC